MTSKHQRARTKTNPPAGRNPLKQNPAKPKDEPRSPAKIWGFRFAALLLAPIFALALLEVILRLAGFGYPTSFLLKASPAGKPLLVQNNRFGWRFFGPQMARAPAAIALPGTKPETTVRIFVFGESAAYGDPQPRFGLPRMLEAMLSLRYPNVHFEVVNAAMTAIDSHVILPIVHDCAKADGDIWVVYMGNNEVVGPFGAGTVFGPATPPLSLVRASLELRSTRTGQALEWLGQKSKGNPGAEMEWGGMMMFLGHQVTADDARMTSVYRNFEQNLADILKEGRRRRVGIVLSTVGVNLKDCAPFASSHRLGLSEDTRAKWDQLYQSGLLAEQAKDFAQASSLFGQAAALDDRFAELRFQEGKCALASGNTPAALSQFQAARDLDTLRFRCDTRLNEIIRHAAKTHQDAGALLADGEQALADASPSGISGKEMFYEHVHLTFEGDYVLARAIAEPVEKLLARRANWQSPTRADWPSANDCARRLGWNDWDLHEAVADIYTRLGDPPFTSQSNHAERMARLAESLRQLNKAIEPSGITTALKSCSDALALAPDDPLLYAQIAALKQTAEDFPGAQVAAQKWADLLPSSGEAWSQLGFLLAKQQHYEAAETALRKAFSMDPQDVWSLQNLAQTLIKLGQKDQAMQEYRRALSIKPRFGMAWLGLGQLLEEQGRKQEAEDCYRKALANRIHRPQELTTLARFCILKGWREAASTNFADALALSPADPMLRLEAGQNLDAMGRHSEADSFYVEATRIAPNLPQAHFLHGLELGRANQSAEAVEEFQTAVRLMPDLLEARLNLGIALVHANRKEQAIQEFEEVLRRSPSNALAQKYLQSLRAAR